MPDYLWLAEDGMKMQVQAENLIYPDFLEASVSTLVYACHQAGQ
jgi:hypothetical protein